MSAEFLAVALGVVVPTILVFGPLITLALLGEARSLRRSGIPQPWFVIRCRLRTLLPKLVHSSHHNILTGRLAWLTWDLHWGPSGETTARVTGRLPAEGALTLVLDQPIEYAAVQLRQVEFYPYKPRAAQYDSVAVRGTLLPEVDSGYRCTATLIVYPDGA